MKATINTERLNHLRMKILSEDFPQCAILDPEEVFKKLEVKDEAEKELVFCIVKHVNCLVQ